MKGDNIFTMMDIEEIAESIDALTDNNNNIKDLASEDYVPPNRKLILKCNGKRKRMMNGSFQQCKVMAKHPTLPVGSKALSPKWIYTIKRDLKGNIIRYKARLVAQGFCQVFGIDYTDTYSLVAFLYLSEYYWLLVYNLV
jgi:Reverse transcriptase (RNA-dependent DNA polymerase)